ncbi:hypothetical protein EYR41_010566 [Orbilia oligospora]|uniref:Condensation domain-containing protein n=1 Tax=Orbilia oligospora TaxID=2813651 RepID=A0A8H2HP56_ORBOL|nr:hypothetical protein EYR41_010566 [Orbilia oligospora]
MHLREGSPDTPKRERKLGFYEKFRVALHDLGYYNNVSIIARYSGAKKVLNSWPQSILRGFSYAIQNHPELSTTIVRDENETLYFQRLSTVDLEQLVTFKSLEDIEGEGVDAKLITLSTSENNKGFQNTSTTPSWGAIALRESSDSFRIAFIWHHVIGDGRSGLAIHQTLLEAFRLFEDDMDCKSNRPATTLDFTRVPASAKQLFASMEEMLPNSSAPVPTSPLQGKKWAGESYSDHSPILTELGHIRISANSVQKVLTKCRKYGTTMTALLQAIVAKSLLDQVPYDRIRTAVAVSLRRFFDPTLGIDDSVMGLWISTYTTEYLKTQFHQSAEGIDNLWQISRENTAQINRVVENGGKDVEIMGLVGVNDYSAAVKSRVGQPRDNSFGLTNLGVFKAVPTDEKYGGIILDDMFFSQSCHANGAAFQICIVTVQDGDMNIVFNWQKGMVRHEEIDGVMGGVKDLMGQIASSG